MVIKIEMCYYIGGSGFMIITSLDNNKIKKYLKLKTKKYRDQERLFLIEGEHLVKEALKSNKLIDLLVLEGVEVTIDFPYTYITSEIIKKLSSLESLPKMIGVVKYIDSKEIESNKVLILDNIQDPGNLGTIIRSSLAFNVKDIILSLDCVDIYNEKVIRSTQGMLFKVNIIKSDLKKIILDLKNKDYVILGTNVREGMDVRDIKETKFALIMGNEGQGVRPEVSMLCDKNLYIKMNKKVESLNVGVATSILLYELNR